MASRQPSPVIGPTLASRSSRRAFLMGCGGALLWPPGLMPASPRTTPAPLVVTVAPPTIVRNDDCTAALSVLVTISQAAPDARFEAHGDIIELDDLDGQPDICCSLVPRAITAENEPFTLLLKGEAHVANLGLVRGIGPAADESFSPDLVELIARIWVREIATNAHLGPWDSPPRIAVASDARDWTRRRLLPGSELMTPRLGGSSASRDGARQIWPLQQCGG